MNWDRSTKIFHFGRYPGIGALAMQKTLFFTVVIAVAANGQKIGTEESNHSSEATQYAAAPTSHADQPACRVKSVRKLTTVERISMPLRGLARCER
jgi:hypothetical protein